MRVASVALEYLDHDTGHWCRTCSLGTGVRIWVAVLYGLRMHLQERLYCYECGGRDVEAVPADAGDS